MMKISGKPHATVALARWANGRKKERGLLAVARFVMITGSQK
jgi:hypothetical protein